MWVSLKKIKEDRGYNTVFDDIYTERLFINLNVISDERDEDAISDVEELIYLFVGLFFIDLY